MDIYTNIGEQLINISKIQQEVISSVERLLPEKSSDLAYWGANIQQMKEESFHSRIAIVGGIGSGVFSISEAILGIPFIPPMAFLPIEVQYGDSNKYLVYPKNGKCDERDDPFELTMESIQDFITNNCRKGESTLERVEFYTPSCKKNIKLTTITLNLFPYPSSSFKLFECDIIVCVMNSLQPITQDDKQTIERLRALGLNNFIFALTNIGVLQYNDVLDRTNEMQRVEEYCLRNLSPYTVWGKEGIFFVDSRMALQGKQEKNQELLEKSQFPAFEKGLYEILTRKQEQKSIRLLHRVQRINATIGQIIAETLMNGTTDNRKKEALYAIHTANERVSKMLFDALLSFLEYKMSKD